MKAGQVAKSVGSSKAKRDAALAKKRGSSASAKPGTAKIDAEVQRKKNQVLCVTQYFFFGRGGGAKRKKFQKRNISLGLVWLFDKFKSFAPYLVHFSVFLLSWLFFYLYF